MRKLEMVIWWAGAERWRSNEMWAYTYLIIEVYEVNQMAEIVDFESEWQRYSFFLDVRVSALTPVYMRFCGLFVERLH